MMHVRPSYFNLLNCDMSNSTKNIGQWAGIFQSSKQADALGSSSRSECNRGAVEADAIGEQQLKRMISGSSSSAQPQRAVRHRITHVGKQGGSS